MRSRQLAIGFGLALAAVASPATARAQAAASPYPAACAAVSPAKSEEAHAFYNAGRALYDEGNYDGAITQFREAYRRDCSKHDLLVIISRSHELKGDRAEAVRALELFLDRVKDSPDAPTHKTKIENLKKQIAAQPPPPPPPPVQAPPPEVREHTVAPWVVVGLGGAAAAVGIVLIATAPSLPAECDHPNNKCDPGSSDTIKSRAEASQNQPLAGGVVLAGGGALILGGLLWHFLEPTGPVTKGALEPRLAPAVAPGYAGVSLGASF
jgi:tetratricopeptide (TPR) repeat protein